MLHCGRVFHIPTAIWKGNSNFICIEHKATEWCFQENDGSKKIMSMSTGNAV